MIRSTKSSVLAVVGLTTLFTAYADTRRFTYSYEPETLPKGGMEFEQWVTLRTQRNDTVGQENYNLWEIRSEFEYGVTDQYSVSLYLNTSNESFRDPTTGQNFSDFRFDGISVENRYMVLNPAEKPVGLTFYFEPRFSGDEAELEEKIILGQRHGKWKWALNLTHATEWTDNLHEVEGEAEGSIGIARDLNKNWSIALEARDHNELPNYDKWENTAVYVGPTVSYRGENWWIALSVLPQVYGANFGENPDGNTSLELEGHERINIRLIFSISF